MLTVSGSHLNSVYRPLMEVTMRSKVKGSEVFTSVRVVKAYPYDPGLSKKKKGYFSGFHTFPVVLFI